MIKKILIISLIILIPRMVLANAGTPLMWVQIIHLIFGNLLIGIIEGAILNLTFKSKFLRAILIMILANYISWIIGTLLIYFFQNTLIDKTFELHYIFQAWIFSLILLFFITVLIETPLLVWIYKSGISFKKSIKYSLIINIITYLGMIVIYLHFSGFSIFTDLKIDQSILDNREEEQIFYFLTSDSKVYSYSIKDKEMELFLSINSDDKFSKLGLNCLNDSSAVSLDIEFDNSAKYIVDSQFCSISDSIYYNNFEYPWYNPSSDFRDYKKRNWHASTGDWAMQGLSILNNDGTRKKYVFDVPWMMWHVSGVAILNNSELIFNINGRIVLLNIEEKKMAFICKAQDFYIKRIVD